MAAIPVVSPVVGVLGVAGDDGAAAEDEDDDEDADGVDSSVLEHPATITLAASSSSGSTSTMEAFAVFMAHACNGPIALWQPQAYNDSPDVAEEIPFFVRSDEL